MKSISISKWPAGWVGFLSGASFGVVLGSAPSWFSWSPLLDFRSFLMEQLNEELARWLPVSWSRGLGHEMPLLSFSFVWAWVGFGISVLIERVKKTDSSPGRLVIRSLAGVLAVFVGLWIFYSGRLLLLHPNQPYWSMPGLFLIGCTVFAVTLTAWSVVCAGRWVFPVLAVLLLWQSQILSPYPTVEAVSKTRASDRELPSQVVLVGVDGVSWDVLLPLVREGKVPHFSRMMGEGAWGHLRTTLPWKSPIIWTSVATGKRERQHGIHDFTQRDPSSGQLVPVSVPSRKAMALWEIASSAGKKVGVVSWFGGWPVEPVNGVMISDRFSYPQLDHRVWPLERLKELEEVAGPIPEMTHENAAKEEVEQREGIRRVEMDRLMRLGPYLLTHDRHQLFMIYTHSTDRMHHWYWKYHAAHRNLWPDRWLQPVSPEEAAAFKNPIEDAYLKADQWLGELLAHVDEKAAVVVMSDHGGGVKGRGKVKYDLNNVLKRMGLLNFLEAERDPDLNQTLLYDNTAGEAGLWKELVVNAQASEELKKRHGFPADPEDQSQWLGEIAKKLMRISSKKNQRIFSRYEIKKLANGILTLRVLVNRGVRPDETIVLNGEVFPATHYQLPSPLSGTHRMRGIFLAKGPGIRHGFRMGEVSVLDVTPTLLYMLGLPVANDMTGRVLREVFDAERLKAHPIQTVPSYETGDTKRSALSVQQSSADQELLAQLRSLGYIQ